MAFTLKAGGVTLPAPVNITATDQIIWSNNTGRTTSGKMVGSAIAKKKTFEVKWGVLTEAEAELILTQMPADFFPLTIQQNGNTTSLTVYRGPVQKELIGDAGDGVTYYRSMTVSIVEQ